MTCSLQRIVAWSLIGYSCPLFFSVSGDISVFGDMDLELPTVHSNRTVVEIHLDFGPSSLSSHEDGLGINLRIPLHVRYPVSVNEYYHCKRWYFRKGMQIFCRNQRMVSVACKLHCLILRTFAAPGWKWLCNSCIQRARYLSSLQGWWKTVWSIMFFYCNERECWIYKQPCCLGSTLTYWDAH